MSTVEDLREKGKPAKKVRRKPGGFGAKQLALFPRLVLLLAWFVGLVRFALNY